MSSPDLHTPDLRALAAEAQKVRVDLAQIESEWLQQCGPCDFGMPEYGCTHPGGDYRPVMVGLVREIEALRRVAAVLPAHRRQVLEEAADACSVREDEANWAYCRDLAFGPGTPNAREPAARARTWRAAKELLRELASAAPEAAPSPRHDAETAPAVPEATPERADVVLPDGTHLYWSTHCRHDRHDACSAAELAPGVPRNPAQCKTCAAPCRCACHVYVDDAASAYRAGQAAAPDDEDVVTL